MPIWLGGAGRSDADLARLGPDVAELVVKVVDVDEVLEVREAQLHHGQEAVATRHQAGRAPQPLQQADSLVDAGSPFVLERRGDLHGSPFSCLQGSLRPGPAHLSTVS